MPKPDNPFERAQLQADRIEKLIEERRARPVSPVIEIVERRPKPETDSPTDVIVPNDVRINGVSLLCSDDPVIVERIEVRGTDVVRVTVTFLARRVVIAHEDL